MVATKKIEVLPSFQVETLPKPKASLPLYIRLGQLGFGTLGRLFPKAAGKLAYRLFCKPRLRAMHRSTDEVLESARISDVLFGKQILKIYEWGHGEKTALLAHGWESRGTALRSFVPGLVASGYRVVAFDGPAHGNSEGQRTNLLHFSKSIRAVVNHIGGIDAIIAHSFGGACSLFFLTQLEPDYRIEKLVLIGVPSNMGAVFQDAFELMNLPPAAQKVFVKIIEKVMGDRPLESADPEHAISRANIGDVLSVHDKFDEAVPFEAAEKVYEKGENVNLLVTQGLGHFLLMKNPVVVQKVVEFVD